jgi:hypothetical protein
MRIRSFPPCYVLFPLNGANYLKRKDKMILNTVGGLYKKPTDGYVGDVNFLWELRPRKPQKVISLDYLFVIETVALISSLSFKNIYLHIKQHFILYLGYVRNITEWQITQSYFKETWVSLYMLICLGCNSLCTRK